MEPDFRLLDLHCSTQAELWITEPLGAGEEWMICMTNLFIDGTAGAKKGLEVQGPAAAGLCVIHEMLDGTLRYAGFAGTLMYLEPGGSAFVGAEKCTNGTAEI